MLYLEKDEKEKARQNFALCVEVAPENPWALNNLAWTILWTPKGDLNDAARFAAKAVELQPENAEFLDTYAQVLARKGSKPDAIARLEKAVRFAPKSPGIWFSLAEISESAGERDKALNAYEHVLALVAPEDSLAGKARQHAEKLRKP